jgi:hypothetical protein
LEACASKACLFPARQFYDRPSPCCLIVAGSSRRL